MAIKTILIKFFILLALTAFMPVILIYAGAVHTTLDFFALIVITIQAFLILTVLIYNP